MQAREKEAKYAASQISRFIGEIVGSTELGEQVVASILSFDEKPTAANIRCRLRETIRVGTFSIHGLGPKRTERLRSALELGKVLYQDLPDVGTVVDDPAIAAQAFHEIAWESVEKLAVLALDVKHRVLSMRVISSGTATETCAHPRDIFRWLIQVGGTRCIVAHNHPSGSLEPSREDLHLTRQLLDAGKVLGVPVLDHLIVSGGEYASIRQSTCLWTDSD
ncbi:MAG: DNA repair protein RadC [Cyanobacteria bacterium J06629_19]